MMAVWRTDGAAKQIIPLASLAWGEAALVLPAAPGARPGTGGSWRWLGDDHTPVGHEEFR